MDYRLEVAKVAVSDVQKAKDFYSGLGWRVDADLDIGGGNRVVQLTPPGSACSVAFGADFEPGLELVVDDIESAQAELVARGVEPGGVYHLAGGKPEDGLAPEHKSYLSYADFTDPDGNSWLLQEVTSRLPGRVTSPLAAYGSMEALASALQRAEDAYAAYEKEPGHTDKGRAEWCAEFMVRESED